MVWTTSASGHNTSRSDLIWSQPSRWFCGTMNYNFRVRCLMLHTFQYVSRCGCRLDEDDSNTYCLPTPSTYTHKKQEKTTFLYMIMTPVLCSCGQSYSGLLTLFYPPPLFPCLWNARPNWKQISNFMTALVFCPYGGHLLWIYFSPPLLPASPFFSSGHSPNIWPWLVLFVHFSPRALAQIVKIFRPFLSLSKRRAFLVMPSCVSLSLSLFNCPALFIIYNSAWELSNPAMWAKVWPASSKPGETLSGSNAGNQDFPAMSPECTKTQGCGIYTVCLFLKWTKGEWQSFLVLVWDHVFI